MKRLQRQGSILLVRGLDKSKPAEHIKENALSLVKNMIIERGLIKQRKGSVSFADSVSERIMIGKEFTRSGVDYTTIITLNGLYLYASGTDTWTDKSGSALTGTGDDIVDVAIPVLSGNRILVFTNGGIDNIKKFDGTNNYSDLGGSPPQAKYITYYKTYTIIGNITDDSGNAYPMRVQWSDTGAPETWSGDNNSGSIDLNEEGNPVTAINTFNEFVTVHKKNCIYMGYLVSNDNIFQFDRKAAMGTVSANTIKELPNGNQIYLAKDGIRIFNGNNSKLVARNISDVLKNIAPEYSTRSWGYIVREQDEYWLGVAVGGQSETSTIYRYNYKTGAVHKDVRDNATCIFTHEKSSAKTIGDLTGTIGEQEWRFDDEYLLKLFPAVVYGTSTGQGYEISEYDKNDASNAIESSFETKDFTCKDVMQLGRWQRLEVFARGNSVKIEYSTDRGGTWKEPSGSPVTLSSQYPTDAEPAILYLDTVSSQIRFRFSNYNSDESFELMQFYVGYIPREIRR